MSVFPRRQNSPRFRRARRVDLRPMLENLEGRVVPTVLSLSGTTDIALANDTASLHLGVGATSAMTAEATFYVPNLNQNGLETLIYKPNAFVLAVNASSSASDNVFAQFWGSSVASVGNTTNLTVGWHHIASTFNNVSGSATISVYLDGSLFATGSASMVTGLNASTNALNVGADAFDGGATSLNPIYPFGGYLDEIRLSDVVRYTGNSYTIPSAQFSIDSHTRALWHFSEAPGATSFADSSGNPNTLTGFNTAQIANVTSPVDGTGGGGSGSISGQKYNDVNGNGVKDPGEPGLAGWTIYVDSNGNGQLDASEPSATTDSNGNYTITGLAPGTYKVAEVPKAGWFQTDPAAGSSSRLFEVRAQSTTATIYELNPTTGAVIHSFPAPAAITLPGPQGLAVGPTSLFYVDGSTNGPHTLYELNLDTGAVIRSDVVDAASPSDIAGLGYLNGKLYLEHFQSSQLQVWDVATHTTVNTLNVAASIIGGTTGAADLGVLFEANNVNNVGQIVRIDPNTGAILATLSPGLGPLNGGLAYVNGKLLAAGYSDPSVVYVIDPSTGALLGNFTPGGGGNGSLSGLGGDGAIAPSVHLVTVGATLPERLFEVRAQSTTATIYELNPTTGAVIHSFPAPAAITNPGPQGLAVGPTSLFYVDGSTNGPHTVYELNPDTGAVIRSDVVDAASPSYIAGLGYLNGKLYLEHYQSSQLQVWDVATHTTVNTLNVAAPIIGGTTGAADLGVLFEANNVGQIFRINPITGVVLATLSPGLGPFNGGLAYVNGKLLAAGFADPSVVFVLDPNTGNVLNNFTPGGGGNGFLTGLGGDGATGVQLNVTGVDFGDRGIGSISGQKYNDLNGNGQKDSGEPGLSGWTIYLDLNHNGQFDAGEPSATTDANGNYTINNVAPGTYNVSEVPKPGWVPTAPTANTSSRLFEVRAVGTTATIYELNPITGAVIHSFPAPASIASSGPQGLAVGPTSLFYIDGSTTTPHILYELNPDTGAVIRSDPVDAANSPPIDGLGYLNGNVYIQEYNSVNHILVWNISTHTVASTLTVATPIVGSVTGAADLNALFVATPNGQILRISPTDGTVIATLTPNVGSILSGMAYVNGQLLVGLLNDPSTVYLVNPTTGAVTGNFTPGGGGNGVLSGLGGDGVLENSMNVVTLTAPSPERLFQVRAVGTTATIYELNPTTGAVINSFPAPAATTFPGPQGLAVGPTSLFYIDGSTNGPHTLYELNEDTGAVIWLGVVDAANPQDIAGVGYLNGRVYLERYTVGQILVWDPTAHTMVTMLNVSAPIIGGLTGAGDLGVLFDESSSGLIYKIDPNTGAVLATLSPGVGALTGGLAYFNHKLLAANFADPSTVYLIDPSTGNVTGSFTPGGGGNGSLTGLGADGATEGNLFVTGVDFGDRKTLPVGSASFVGTDTATRGDWMSLYGYEGFEISQDVSSNNPTYPSYVNSVDIFNATNVVWNSSTNDPGALRKSAPGSTDRLSAAWLSSTYLLININVNDHQAHRVALYARDFNTPALRSERIDVIDTATGILLDSQTLNNFTDGVYLTWNFSHNVMLVVTNLKPGVTDAVISGLFFGAGATTTPGVLNTTAGGSWKSLYGSDGYQFVGDVSANGSALPSYVSSLTMTGVTPYVWSSASTDPSALQKSPSNATDRVAAVWYGDTMTFNIRFSDAQTHRIALYAIDYNQVRTETVSIIDDATHATLDTQSLSNMYTGKWLVWDVSGSVTIVVTNTGPLNAVVSGLFFGGAATSTGGAINTTTSGSWKGVFGSDGYEFVGDVSSSGANLPSYISSLTVSGGAPYTWDGASSNPAALQKSPSNATDRVAAVWHGNSMAFDIRFNDTATHRIALYALDYNYTRTETVQLVDAGTGAVLDTQSLSNMYAGKWLVWDVSGSVQIVVTNTGPYDAVVSGLFFGKPTAATAGMVNTTTGGSWKNVFGSDGYQFIGDASADGSSLPSYVSSLTVGGAATYVWDGASTNLAALQKSPVNATDRVAAVWYGNTLTYDIHFNDTATHRIALYALDYNYNRSELVSLVDAGTGVVLSSTSLSNMGSGKWVVWDVSGSVRIVVTNTGPTNAVVSGLFFGSPTSASFVTTDTATQGNWKSTYGQDGYQFIGDVSGSGANLPGYVSSLGISGASTYVWESSSSNPAALTKSPNGSTDGVAAVWDGTSMMFDIHFNDTAKHRVAIYLLDYNGNRTESISVVDDGSGTVLDTQSVSGMSNGKWLVWDVIGSVSIIVTNTGPTNAVLSGLFFGPAS